MQWFVSRLLFSGIFVSGRPDKNIHFVCALTEKSTIVSIGGENNELRCTTYDLRTGDQQSLPVCPVFCLLVAHDQQ